MVCTFEVKTVAGEYSQHNERPTTFGFKYHLC